MNAEYFCWCSRKDCLHKLLQTIDSLHKLLQTIDSLHKLLQTIDSLHKLLQTIDSQLTNHRTADTNLLHQDSYSWDSLMRLIEIYGWYVVPPAGFEPAAPGLGILCSIP
jgi:hypothetical protein